VIQRDRRLRIQRIESLVNYRCSLLLIHRLESKRVSLNSCLRTVPGDAVPGYAVLGWRVDLARPPIVGRT
jgi:hypothetical protein